MSRRVRWGVLGAAKINGKVVPPMRDTPWSEVVAIASRDIDKAREAADRLLIPRAYGSYEELLGDPGIDAIYNPLPNHLHMPWSIRAAEAGKHVLCEKPLGMNAREVELLIAARDRTGVKMQEAFMVRFAPQWLETLRLLQSGRIGALRSFVGTFSYFNDDRANIRNVQEFGGGALMDVGCYLVMTARLVFGTEPTHASALIQRDATDATDTLTSISLEFPGGHAVGTCSTRMSPYQRVQLIGTAGRIDIEIPFNAPTDRPCRLFVDDGRDIFGGGVESIAIATNDQYRAQGEAFSRAILDDTDAPYPLEESLANMRVMDALKVGESGS